MKVLVDLMASGKVRVMVSTAFRVAYFYLLSQLKEPEHEILTLPESLSDEEASQKVRDVIGKIAEGQYGKKVLLRVEGS